MSKKIHIILRIILLIIFLGAAMPAPVQAAETQPITGWKGPCACYYQVEKRDTVVKIARMFGITAKELADANFITTSTKLKVGSFLCIPKTAIKIVYPKAKLSGTVIFNHLTITGSNFPKEETFIVRIRARREATWTKLGVIKTKKDGTFERSFRIPKDLQNARYFEVCLKHSQQGYSICSFVPRLW